MVAGFLHKFHQTAAVKECLRY